MKAQTIWITGASSGIGEALTYAYHQLGAKIIISARNEVELLRVKSNCKQPNEVCILTVDLEDHASLSNKAIQAIKIFGRIDMLINSGGISQRSLAMQTALITEKRFLDINFWGTVILSKAVLPQMVTQNSGSIIAISSLVGKFGTKYRSAYSASKHALHGYFESLRVELDQTNIHVMLACPGFIKTNITINALKADGLAQGSMDDAQAKGMLSQDFAKQLIKDIKARKEEVYIGGSEVRGILIKRLFPKLFAKLIRKVKVV